MKYDFSKLRGRIREVFGTQNEFAEAMQMAPNTLSAKLNNITDFSSNEISKAVELLKINSTSDAWDIFFTKELEFNSSKQL